MNIVIIGLGGIGSHVIRPLSRYCSSLDEETSITLIDGDEYQPKNHMRQEFVGYGPKASVIAREMSGSYPGMRFKDKHWYITDDNAYVSIYESDIVFSCVDSHAVRRVVSRRCEQLENVVLISGGNEYKDGNVQLFVRRHGVNMTPPITVHHPEIENPTDKNPADMGCEELAASSTPQLIFTNVLASAWMLATFWRWHWSDNYREDILPYSELYFDLATGNARSVQQPVRKGSNE